MKKLGPRQVFTELSPVERAGFVTLIVGLVNEYHDNRIGRHADSELSRLVREYRKKRTVVEGKRRAVVLALDSLAQCLRQFEGSSYFGLYLRAYGEPDTELAFPDEVERDTAKYRKMTPSSASAVKTAAQNVIDASQRSLTRKQAIVEVTCRLVDWLRSNTRLGQDQIYLRTLEVMRHAFGDAVANRKLDGTRNVKRSIETIRSRCRPARRKVR